MTTGMARRRRRTLQDMLDRMQRIGMVLSSLLVSIVAIVAFALWVFGLGVGTFLLFHYWPLLFALNWRFILEVSIGVFGGLFMFGSLCLAFALFHWIDESRG